jgi:serine/threonine protein phosphatase PrpC
MPKPDLTEVLVVLDGQDAAPCRYGLGCGSIAVLSRACPLADGSNEDALAVIPCDDNRAVLAVADGFGGQPAGDQAARLAMEALVAGVANCLATQKELRDGILNGFEAANRAVMKLGIGAATTLAVAEVDNGIVRSYHAGDSEIVIVGQKGKLKLQTVSHSPVGFGVESGLIHRDDAIHHDERNIVSNMVGSSEMRIEIGPHVRLRPRDRLFLGTDGVFDNLSVPEVVELIRKGPIDVRCREVVDACTARMKTPEPGLPSKPDDIAIVLFCPD